MNNLSQCFFLIGILIFGCGHACGEEFAIDIAPLHERAGGWPHFFGEGNMDKYNHKDVLETLPYYDVVNFARNISVPGFYSWGSYDETTPPKPLSIRHTSGTKGDD
jgi:cephalosporin-C deacetylase-like acetyl esterase